MRRWIANSDAGNFDVLSRPRNTEETETTDEGLVQEG